MRLELTGRHLSITPTIRKLAEGRVAHTLRLLNDSVVSAHVVLTREHTRIHAEVTLHARRERFLHGEATGKNVELALNAAADKVDRQARTLKGKRQARRRRGPSAAEAAQAAAQGPSAAPAPPLKRRIIRPRRHPGRRQCRHRPAHPRRAG
jgi:ribosomal subunit interface protein